MNEENIAKIVLAYLTDIVRSVKTQIAIFVICLSLLVFPDFFHINDHWLIVADTASRLIIIFLLVVWIIQFFIWTAQKKHHKQQVIKLLRNTITQNRDYASYEENNLMYIAYINNLRVFSFDKICDYKDEMALYHEDGVEETLNILVKNEFIHYKKGKYFFPKHIWKELAGFHNSKQLRKKS